MAERKKQHWRKHRDNNGGADPIDPRLKFERGGKFAAIELPDNVHVVEQCRHFNGSGVTAFGGVRSWPVLKVHVAFPDGREDLRDALGAQIRDVIDEFLELHGL